MYFDQRLWALTSGVRGRIAFTVLVGLAAVAAGIARLALLGWLLGRVLAGESLASLAPAIALTALALAARSALDYARTMVAHHTAARVQERLRQILYAQVASLGPAHFARARTGDVMLSLVEGVQQLETYFGQYLPQLFVSALTPLLIFAFVAFVDLPVALVLLGAAVALALGAWRVSTGAMSVPALLVILMLGVEVFRPLRELRILLHQGMLGLSAARGIFALLDAVPAVSDRPDGPEPADARVAFEGVTFAYPGARRPAHVELSFRVQPGERVAIVGPSGSGKSTIARLLLRFHDPDRGRVTIGGRDLRELSLEQIRSRVALVSQDTWLFHGTVEDNIRMGKPDASTHELEAATRAANAEECILRLPQGYDTVVGERGVRLSGGQRQRIAIARALLRDAPILVLDEALSSVGAESRALTDSAPDRLMRGRTTLVFAHRLSSVVVGVRGRLPVRAGQRVDPSAPLLVGLLVVAPLAGILHWAESWLAHDVAYRLLTDMRLAVFHKLDALAPAYLTRRRSGDLVGAATHDVELIEYFFAHTITPAFVAVLIPAAVLVALGAYGAALVLVLLPFLLYTALVPILGRTRIDRLGSRAREASGDLNAHVVDTVQGLAEIVAYRRVNAWGEALGAKARRFYELRLPLLRDLARQTAFQETATGLGGLAVIAVGAWLAHEGRLDAGTLPLLTLLALSAFVPLWEVAQVGRQLADTLGAARRLGAVDAEPVPVTDGPGVPAVATRGAVAVELADVRFAYPSRPRPALDGVSLRIQDGSTVALVGPSGAGKTTVASLPLRFWDPQSGVIRLFGHDLREYQLDELRRRIALVAQDTYLFNDTLRANILLARPDADDAALGVAIEPAALGGLVASLPDGRGPVVGGCRS